MIDYKKLFQCFPVIEDQFDLIAIDCILIEQEQESFYVPIIRYMMRNHLDKKIDAGVTLRTSSICQDLEEVAEFLEHLTKLGFFLNDISAYGTVYNEDMDEIEEVNWNNIMRLKSDDTDQPEQQKPTYLH